MKTKVLVLFIICNFYPNSFFSQEMNLLDTNSIADKISLNHILNNNSFILKDEYKLQNKSWDIDNLLLQIFVSNGTGLAGYFVGQWTFGYLDNEHRIPSKIGFIFGQAYGIFLMASKWNKNITYLGSLLFSGIGAAGAVAIGWFNGWQKDWTYGLLVFPLISTLLYANIFSTDNNQQINHFENYNSPNVIFNNVEYSFQIIQIYF